MYVKAQAEGQVEFLCKGNTHTRIILLLNGKLEEDVVNGWRRKISAFLFGFKAILLILSTLDSFFLVLLESFSSHNSPACMQVKQTLVKTQTIHKKKKGRLRRRIGVDAGRQAGRCYVVL